MGIHGTPDLGDLLTARIDYITDATNITLSSHSWLRSIGVVFEVCTKGQFCVEDGFLPGPGHTATFGNKLVLRSGMVNL